MNAFPDFSENAIATAYAAFEAGSVPSGVSENAFRAIASIGFSVAISAASHFPISEKIFELGARLSFEKREKNDP